MTSKIKVDNINKVSDDTNIIKKCGTTTTIGSGASNPIVVDGSAVTLGRCGGTVALASGATQTGFGRTGTVDWQTTPKTSTFTAVSGEGYFANTSGSAFNMNLPAGVAGAIVSVADYAATFNSNNLTIVPNGSDKIGNQNDNAILATKGQSVTLVFVDSTQGWINTMDSTSNVRGINPFIVATGGTITTSGNDKIHTFTGPGTFAVCTAASCATNNQVSYIVVAGGGAGGDAGDRAAGGGGAGGFRETKSPATPYTASPLDGQPSAPNRITVTATNFPITVGAGGASRQSPNIGNNGNPSTFSTITSTAGGGGGGEAPSGPNGNGQPGGSGGGAGRGAATGSVGSGNTPPTSPAQGKNGGSQAGGADSTASGGGGGGATAVGANASSGVSGNGGAGATTEITASPVAYAGGGGGAGGSAGSSTPGTGGTGGGGNGTPYPSTDTGGNATINTGGGGGGASTNAGGGAGGSGIVVIRYKFQ